MRHGLILSLILAVSLASCTGDPSPLGFVQPEMGEVQASVQDDGTVHFSCAMNDTGALTECGFCYHLDGAGPVQLQGTVIDDKTFAADSPELEEPGLYLYYAYAGNGKTRLESTEKSFRIEEDPIIPRPPKPDGPKSMIIQVSAEGLGSVYLPLRGKVAVTIDWGDGNLDYINDEYTGDNWVTHRYKENGLYDVTIAGKIECFSTFHEGKNMPVPDRIRSLKRWGDLGTDDYANAFVDCSKLESVAADSLKIFANVTHAEFLFTRCSSLRHVPDSLLAHCKSENLSGVFNSCKLLQEIPPHIFLDCSSADDFEMTFFQCESLTSVPEGLFDDCVEAWGFIYTFADCKNLVSVPETLFDRNRKAFAFSGTFYDCINVKNESPYTLVSGKKVHLYERKEYPELFKAPSMYNDCFHGHGNVFVGGMTAGWKDYASIPKEWKTEYGNSGTESFAARSRKAIRKACRHDQ